VGPNEKSTVVRRSERDYLEVDQRAAKRGQTVKIKSVVANNKKARLELTVFSGKVYPYPYVLLEPPPTLDNKIKKAYIDRELGCEGVTYELASGEEGTVHIDYALEYNRDPKYLGEMLLYELTVQARDHIKKAGLSRREIARRLNTSLPQLYRLLDQTNTKKSINQMISLLCVLNCDVEVVVKERQAA
jgi:predicted XRE-type DNA-binding protein